MAAAPGDLREAALAVDELLQTSAAEAAMAIVGHDDAYGNHEAWEELRRMREEAGRYPHPPPGGHDLEGSLADFIYNQDSHVSCAADWLHDELARRGIDRSRWNEAVEALAEAVPHKRELVLGFRR